MVYKAVEVYHKNLLNVIEAICILNSNANVENIEKYSDITENATKDAIHLAEKMDLIELNGTVYQPKNSYSNLLSNASHADKKNILKFILYEHEPFYYFAKLIKNGENATRAAHKTQQVFGIIGSQAIVMNTFVELGKFSNIFNEDDAGNISVNLNMEPEIKTIFESIHATLEDRAQIDIFIENYLDPEALKFIEDYKERLIQTALNFVANPKHAIRDLGDIFEDFIKKVCSDRTIDYSGTSGISSVGALLATNNLVKTKHRGYFEFLTHMRNAATHNRDAEIDGSWDMTSDTSFNVFLVILSAINSIHASVYNGEYKL